MKEDLYSKLDDVNIVTPGLFDKFFEFIAHLEISKDDPILITGPTGVGKSLFINMVRKNLDENKKFAIANCAHFDLTTAESELFGHKKGAFTGATKEKVGLIKKADGGTLVLDEIGELHKRVQAKLLMFLETGVFYPVGSEKSEHAVVRMVGATSRKNKLRKEFFHRFFEFAIPPLYERRMDVLYYTAMKYPDHIKSLTPSDILMLLSNNWSGNLREVNNVVVMIQRRESKQRILDNFYLKSKKNSTPSRQARFFTTYNPEESEGFVSNITSASSILERSKINATKFESFLNGFGLGLDTRNETRIFESKLRKLSKKDQSIAECLATPTLLKFDMEIPKRFGVKLIVDHSLFSDIEKGFEIFCSLFFQDPCGNKNVLDVSKPSSPYMPLLHYPVMNLYGKRIESEGINSWARQVFECLSGIGLSSNINLMAPIDQRMFLIKKIHTENPENRFLESFVDNGLLDVDTESFSDQQDYWSWDYEEFQKFYFQTLVERNGWNVAKAAKCVNMIPNTLRSNLRRYGIKRPDNA